MTPDQVRHVIAGRLLDGSKSSLPPIGVRCGPEALGLLAQAIDLIDGEVLQIPNDPCGRFDPDVRKTAVAYCLLKFNERHRDVTPARVFDSYTIAKLGMLLAFRDEFRTPAQLFQRAIAHAQEFAVMQRDHMRPHLGEDLDYTPPWDRPNRTLPRHPKRWCMWRSACGGYALERLHHPFHLVTEGRVLQHCIGSRFNFDQPPKPRQSMISIARQLCYYREIENKSVVVYSFGRCSNNNQLTPIATILIGRRRSQSRIKTIALKRNHQVNGTEPFFPALVDAFAIMSALHANMTISAPMGKRAREAILKRALPPERVTTLLYPFQLTPPTA